MKYLILFMLILPLQAAAQLEQDSRSVIEQAVSHVRIEILPAGAFTVHPGFLAEPRAGLRSASISLQDRALGDLLAASGAGRFEPLQETVTCDRLPSSCRMANNGVAAIGLSAPTFDRDTASITMNLRYRSDSRRTPIVDRTVVIDLVRTSDGWQVSAMRTIRMT